jgi:hypothetical protein
MKILWFHTCHLTRIYFFSPTLGSGRADQFPSSNLFKKLAKMSP